MILKEYTISTDITGGTCDICKLTEEIRESGFVNGFIGITIGVVSGDGEFDVGVEDLDKFTIEGGSWANEASCDSLIASHVSALSAIEAIKSAYAAHEVAGKEFYADVRADLANKAITAEITYNDAYNIEQSLRDVKENILTGDWKTAQYHMTLVTVAAPLTQDIYDSIKDPIDDYITNNY